MNANCYYNKRSAVDKYFRLVNLLGRFIANLFVRSNSLVRIQFLIEFGFNIYFNRSCPFRIL